MWSAPLMSLLCMVTVLWKSRLLCYSPVWFLGIELLTLGLLCGTAIPLLESALCYSPLTSHWNPYTAFTCLVSWNPCCAVYTCSCPVWGHWACLTSWPPQPWGRVPHILALVLQSVLLEGVRDMELCGELFCFVVCVNI